MLNSAQEQVSDETSLAQAARLANLRAHLASSLAAEFLAATPHVRIAFQSEFNQCTNSDERDTLRFAWNVLSTRRDQLALQIERSLLQRFDAKLDGPADALSHTGQFSIDALALMEELGMREEYEIEQCVEQLREQCNSELSLLAANLRQLLGCKSLPESRNPAFPRVMLRAVMDALTHIGCNVRTRQVALHTCGPLLSKIIKDIYSRANAMLAGEESHNDAEFHNACGDMRLAA